MNESSQQRIPEDGDATVIVTEIQRQKSLVEACLTGDQAAWQAFWEKFERPLLKCIRFEFRRRGAFIDENVVRDIAEDILVSLWHPDRPRLRDCNFERGDLGAFLQLLIKSGVVLQIRRWKRAQKQTSPLDGHQPSELHASDWEINLALEEILDCLSPREKTIALARLGEPPVAPSGQELSSSNGWKVDQHIKDKIHRHFRLE